MPRLKFSYSPLSFAEESSLYREPSTPRPEHQPSASQPRHDLSGSPSASSDKENQQAPRSAKSTNVYRSREMSDAPSSKRRRLGDRQSTTSVPLNDRGDSSESAYNEEESDGVYNDDAQQSSTFHGSAPQVNIYDPHQDIDERRKIRNKFRELEKDAQDERQNWMDPRSRGLEKALEKSNELFRNVKQTADATIDSHFLVNAGDMTFKKSKQINLGDNSQGVDVDEFVGKCISFMREGAQDESAGGLTSTQRRRRQTAPRVNVADEEEEDDEGNALDWLYFGARACLPMNMRPPISGFLLGPLSVQRRARRVRVQATNRRRPDNVQGVQAAELRESDLNKTESSSVKTMCTKIRKQLAAAQTSAHATLDREFEKGINTEEEERRLFNDLGLCDDGGLSLFKFAINPRDFGQTVENLFYTSFLVRDSGAEIRLSGDDGMPSIRKSSVAPQDLLHQRLTISCRSQRR